MKKLIILGTGAFAEEVADLVDDCEVAGFGENLSREKVPCPLLGRPVHWVEDLPRLAATHEFVCAIGTTARVRFTDQADALGLTFARVCHPSSRLGTPAGVLAHDAGGLHHVATGHARYDEAEKERRPPAS